MQTPECCPSTRWHLRGSCHELGPQWDTCSGTHRTPQPRGGPRSKTCTSQTRRWGQSAREVALRHECWFPLQAGHLFPLKCFSLWHLLYIVNCNIVILHTSAPSLQGVSMLPEMYIHKYTVRNEHFQISDSCKGTSGTFVGLP